LELRDVLPVDLIERRVLRRVGAAEVFAPRIEFWLALLCGEDGCADRSKGDEDTQRGDEAGSPHGGGLYGRRLAAAEDAEEPRNLSTKEDKEDTEGKCDAAGRRSRPGCEAEKIGMRTRSRPGWLAFRFSRPHIAASRAPRRIAPRQPQRPRRPQ